MFSCNFLFFLTSLFAQFLVCIKRESQKRPPGTQVLVVKMSAEKLAYAYFFNLQSNETSTQELMVTLDEPNLFEDPFESLGIKVSASIAFLCGLVATMVLCERY